MSALLRGLSLRLAALELVPGVAPAPKWNLLFPANTTMYRSDFPGGEIAFSSEFLTTMVANWERLGRPELPIDYFHRGESANDGLPVEEKVAAGWISDMRASALGLEVLIGWTERARKHIAADELRYLSPTFSVDAPDKLEGGMQGPTLFGAGLLNDPFLQQLPRVAASNSPPNTTAPAATTSKEQHMDKKQICAALGLPEDTPEAEVMEKLKALNAAKASADATAAAAQAQASASATQSAQLADVAQKLELATKSQGEVITKLTARVAELEGERKKLELEALCEQLITDKKVLPAHRDQVVAFASKAGVDEARKFFSALPAQSIPTEELGTGKDEAPPEGQQLKAQYDAELDALITKGVKTQMAARQLRADPKFRPLFTATQKN